MCRVVAIKKRDGQIVNFDKEKIFNAIFKAAKSVGGEDTKIAKDLAQKVESVLDAKFGNLEVPTVEDVQDIVEKVLIEEGHAKTAKAYILYRNQHNKLRESENLLVDINKIMTGYLGQLDWRVKENSNVHYSIGGLILHNSGSVVANYWLNEVYDNEIAKAHKDGDFHIHDLSMFSGYCAGWSLRQLIEEGFGGVKNKISSKPPKHMNTLIHQMINFLGTLQNEWAGAQAFSSFDTYLAPFVRADNLSYKEVKQNLQTFIFSINVPSRWGSQAPFSNITLDWTIPPDLKDKQAIVGGKKLETTYSDYQKEMDMINKAFIELMMEGDADGRGFAYPIPTYNITPEFDWDSENAKLLFEMTAKYGTPYFQNFINSDLDPSDVRSMCCRLQLDKRELRKRGGALFGSDEFTGSIGVVTINLPRIGFLSKTKIEYFSRLESLMDVAKRSLEIKRKVVQKLMDQGLFPYTQRYLKHLNNHFSTIGINGMNESCLNFIGEDISTNKGREFTLEVLDFMRNKLSQIQEETGNLYNLEATPGEGTSYRLAKIDKEKYPEIIASGVNDPYYTNSTQLPVDKTIDIFEAIEHQDEIQKKYTGGTVLHCFIGEKLESYESCKSLVKKVAYNAKLPYFTISPTYSVCPDHGYISGEHFNCPTCNHDTEVYSRIVGYYRPVGNWNKGKREEFDLRVAFDEKVSLQSQKNQVENCMSSEENKTNKEVKVEN